MSLSSSRQIVEGLPVFSLIRRSQTAIVGTNLIMGQPAVHHQLVTAEPFPKRSTGSFLLVFRHIQRQGLIFRPISPAHGLVLPYPPFMLHRGKYGRVLCTKAGDPLKIHRLIRIEASDCVQVGSKIPGASQGGEPVFQRAGVEFFLHLLPDWYPAGMLLACSASAKSYRCRKLLPER